MSAKIRDREAPVPAKTFKPIPFMPKRGLFFVTAALNVLWIGALIMMYFTTVRNKQHAMPAPAPAAIENVQGELQRELDDLNATTRPGADGSPSAPR